MKKIIVLACVATMVMGLVGAASAQVFDDAWKVQIRAGDENYQKNNSTGNFGTKVGGSDGYVSPGEDSEMATLLTDAVNIYTQVDGKKLVADVRTPLSLTNPEIVWQITVAPTAGFTGEGITVKGWLLSSSAYDIADDVDFTVTLYQVSEFGGDRTFKWLVDPTINGTSTSNYWDSGVMALGTYKYELVASYAVPEPGSMVALLSGMAGLAGFAIRRRK